MQRGKSGSQRVATLRAAGCLLGRTVLLCMLSLLRSPLMLQVHKQLVTLLSADDYLLGGTVEQIASASDWAAYALWFAVLAVCAPVGGSCPVCF